MHDMALDYQLWDPFLYKQNITCITVKHKCDNYYYYYYSRFTTLCPGLPRWVVTRRINHSGFCWSRHDGTAVASSEPRVVNIAIEVLLSLVLAILLWYSHVYCQYLRKPVSLAVSRIHFTWKLRYWSVILFTNYQHNEIKSQLRLN